MAVRIENLTKHALRLDLRGGAVHWLPAGGTTVPLRVEDLYENPYLAEWRSKGWIAEHKVPFEELTAHEAGATPQAPSPAAPRAPRAPHGTRAGGKAKSPRPRAR